MSEAHRDLIVVGASAGGVEALKALVRPFSDRLEAAIVIVIHLPAGARSALAAILARVTRLPVATSREDEPLENGHVYVAPPDRHLLVRDNRRLALVAGPRINRHRPAIDPLFYSAARWAGPRAIGVILSGMLDDGVSGLAAIVRNGGRSLVQSLDDAAYSDMPQHALRAVGTSAVAPASAMADLLLQWTGEKVSGEWTLRMTDEERREAELDLASTEHPPAEGTPSPFSCPDCHGTLFEVGDDPGERYRCRVGHAYSAAFLADGQRENIEETIWSAYRALRESAALQRRCAERARAGGRERAALAFELRAAQAKARADGLEQLLGPIEPDASPSDE